MSDAPEICETWCGRDETPDGCQCLGKLRRALADLESMPSADPAQAARNAELGQRLRRVLSGRFDPRTEWPGRRG